MSTEWTIATLKAHFDALRQVDREALELQAAENKRRLDELNHEHARVAQAQQTYVSKDTWDGFLKSDQAWKAAADRSSQASLPRVEFQAYKDTTERALTLKAGQSAGVGLSLGTVVQIITSLASAAVIVTLIVALARH